MNTPTLFAIEEKARHPKRVVRTTYMDERELLNDVLWLYNGGKGVDVDPCYSVGRFWTGLPKPAMKFDINPQLPEVQRAESTNLPLSNESVKSIMFDPPFLTQPMNEGGIMDQRFTAFESLDDLQDMYTESLSEFYRVLAPGGLLIFKCQDVVHYHKQFLTHVFVVEKAELEGFTCHDCIIYINDRVPLAAHIKSQQHARKTHCYYLIFSKGNKNPAVRKVTE